MIGFIDRKNVMKRLPGRALNRLQELPKFNDDLLELIYKRTQEEADAGSSTLDEFGPNTFNKESLEGYDVEEHYEKLCTTFPTAMTVAAALVTKKKDCAEGVKVVTFVYKPFHFGKEEVSCIQFPRY